MREEQDVTTYRDHGGCPQRWYGSEEAALRFVEGFVRETGMVRWLRVYQCPVPECLGWHVTTERVR